VTNKQPGPAVAWLGPFREPVRERFFTLLQQAFATDRGRRLLADALQGLLPHGPAERWPGRVAGSCNAYPELGRAPVATGAAGPPPIFITGRFRSGSTMLWQIFRKLPGMRAYYEPLNERRWFDPQQRGNRVDPTHLGVSDYWLEYEGLERLNAVFQDSWIDRHLFMDEGFSDPDLKAYVHALVEAARPGRAVLQFNRVDFRLPWLRRTFPHAQVLHIYRHPREQWCSALGDIRAFPRDAHFKDFAAHDRFYLLAWARDLRFRFPFLDEARVSHPYQLFYFIWLLSWQYGQRHADYSVQFERLVAEPESELPRMLRPFGITDADVSGLARVMVAQPQGKWRSYADDAWFRAHESACEAVIEDFFSESRARGR
jgi:hypothetical protein